MLQEIINSKNLPDFKSREVMLDILQREEYGYIPPKPDSVSFEQQEGDRDFCAGKAIFRKVNITSKISETDFTFPVYVTIPAKSGKHPFFVCMNFRDNVPDMYMPTEEIIDNGFAVLSFCYNDVTKDNEDFTDGLSGILFKDGKREPHSPGKIAMWAWAAMRVMDYARTLDNLDFECSVVCGHSRLGKTALLAGAYDERFKFVYSNNSGCSGAAISRGKEGESIYNICDKFPYWFCENYKKYVNNEYNMPFDQHWLMALAAPRYVYVASAGDDTWADPVAEMLCCAVSGKIYSEYNMPGFVCDDRLPIAGDLYHEGSIGYHMRSGRHYFSREDWQKAICFINKHRKEDLI